MDYIAIDFETANKNLYSACQIGLVHFRNGEIIEEYTQLIKPPYNEYGYWNTRIHGISPVDTKNESTFLELAEEILPRLENKIIVAHNATFDRRVLLDTMKYYGLVWERYQIARKWECTLKIYRSKGHKKNNLKACCERMGIELHHHDALSDARACAHLYMRQ